MDLTAADPCYRRYEHLCLKGELVPPAVLVMHVFKSALLPHRADQIFDVINDIESYPDYFDGCTGSKILHCGEDVMEARLDIRWGGWQRSFTSRNHLDPPSGIRLELLEGPMEALSGQWKIQTLGDVGCKVSFTLDLEMGGVLQALLEQAVSEAADSLVDAIATEARRRYGSSS